MFRIHKIVWRSVLMYVLHGTVQYSYSYMGRRDDYSTAVRVQPGGFRVPPAGTSTRTAEYTTATTRGRGTVLVLVQTRRDHRYKVLVLVRPRYDAETRDPRDTDVRVLVRVQYPLCRPAFRTRACYPGIYPGRYRVATRGYTYHWVPTHPQVGDIAGIMYYL